MAAEAFTSFNLTWNEHPGMLKHIADIHLAEVHDCFTIAEILAIDDRVMIIPAHIWTPWFSMLGSKSGFDSLEECFEDIAPFIHAVETGLSADPPMLARVASLPTRWRRHPILRARRFAVVPLLVQGRPIGVVSADNKPSRRPVTRRGVAHLELFCQQLATSVNNARLYGETRQRERDATLLLEVTRKLSSTLELDAVLDLVADGTIEALGCAAAGFYRWDATRGGLVFVRGRNHPESFSRPLLMRAGEGITGRAYAERRPAWTNDRLADSSLAYAADNATAMQRPDAPRAYLAVPIMIRDEVFGVLGGSYFTPHVFTEREVNLLSSLAAIKYALGDLDRVHQAVQLIGFVNSAPGFHEQPRVINGATDLLVELYGDRGKPTRAAIGCQGLALGHSVEVVLTVLFSGEGTTPPLARDHYVK